MFLLVILLSCNFTESFFFYSVEQTMDKNNSSVHLVLASVPALPVDLCGGGSCVTPPEKKIAPCATALLVLKRQLPFSTPIILDSRRACG